MAGTFSYAVVGLATVAFCLGAPGDTMCDNATTFSPGNSFTDPYGVTVSCNQLGQTFDTGYGQCGVINSTVSPNISIGTYVKSAADACCNGNATSCDTNSTAFYDSQDLEPGATCLHQPKDYVYVPGFGITLPACVPPPFHGTEQRYDGFSVHKWVGFINRSPLYIQPFNPDVANANTFNFQNCQPKIGCLSASMFEVGPAAATIHILIATFGDITELEPGFADPLPELAVLDLDGNQLTQIRNGTFTSKQSKLIALLLWRNQIHTIETGALAPLTSLSTLIAVGNRLTRIPPALKSVGSSLRELILAGNNIDRIVDGDLEGLVQVRSFAMEGNPIIKISATALQELTAMGVPPAELVDDRTNQTLINGVGIIIPAGDLDHPGPVGGRVSQITAVVLQPLPTKCTYVGPYVHNMTCNDCDYGYELNVSSGECELPDDFVVSRNWNASNMDAAFGGILVKGQGHTFPAPQLEIKDLFAGYTGFNYMAIRYEIDFQSTVDIGCELAVSDNSATEVDPVRLSRFGIGGNRDPPFNHIRNLVFNQVDRPVYKRFTVTTAGTFNFNSCDSLYTTSITIYHRNSSRYDGNVHSGSVDTYPTLQDMVKVSNGTRVHDWIGGPQAGYYGQFLSIPGVVSTNDLFNSTQQWVGGCQLGASTNRTIYLPEGEYTLGLRIFPLYDDVGGVYVVKMNCLDGARAVSPESVSNPGGLSVDASTGQITGFPQTVGTYSMRLLGVDGAGRKAVVKSWDFNVIENTFGVIESWNATALDSSRNIASKYHVSTIYEIKQPRIPKTGLFVNPTSPITNRRRSEAYDQIVYLLSVTVIGQPTGCTLPLTAEQKLVTTDILTGAGSLRLACSGTYSAELKARDSSGSDVIVNEWNFVVGPRDTYNESNGPNGQGCLHNSAMIDEITMDNNFTCDCNGTGYIGQNCEVPVASSSSSSTNVETGATLSVILVCCIFVALILAYSVYMFNKRRKTTKEIAKLTKLANGDVPEHADLDTAMFDALHLQQDLLLPQLLDLGASASARQPHTLHLPHMIIMSRHTVNREILIHLFRKNCTIDAQCGALLENNWLKLADVTTVLIELVKDQWKSPVSNGTVLHQVVDWARKTAISTDVAVHIAKALLQADPQLLLAVDNDNNSAGDYSTLVDGSTELQKLLTVVVYNRFQLTNPSTQLYKSPTAIVMECKDLLDSDDSNRSLEPPSPNAMTRAKSDRSAFSEHPLGNTRMKTKGPRSLSSEHPPDATTKTKGFRSPSSEHPPKTRTRRGSFSSPSAAAQRAVATLEGMASKRVPLVIKMMSDGISWRREIESRQLLHDAPSGVIPIRAIACSNTEVDVVSGHTVVRQELEATVHQIAAALVKQYPYALIMEKAERNLLEVINNERLATEPLASTRVTASKICTCIKALHDCSVVHSDIKPRNVVRMSNNVYNLIDFDMAFTVGKETSSMPSTHASVSKIKDTNAYSCPELLKWSCSTTENTQPLHFTPDQAKQIDIWNYGVMLYEMVTGTSLLPHSYDVLTEEGQARLASWEGLRPADVKAIRYHHPEDDCTALLDLLHWCLDPDPKSRPATIQDVLDHAFFRPSRGSMRAHWVIDRIREMIECETGPRPLKRVMVSYCWANSTFVLDRLCLALAPLCDGLWLDRLGSGYGHGMGELINQSMEQGVESCDLVIAVVSPEYVQSDNCGFEMKLAAEHGKPVIPIKFGIPMSEWPPARVGNTKMTSQFGNSRTGDMKLFVDMEDVSQFNIKFERELMPRLLKEKRPSMRPSFIMPTDDISSPPPYEETGSAIMDSGSFSSNTGIETAKSSTPNTHETNSATTDTPNPSTSTNSRRLKLINNKVAPMMQEDSSLADNEAAV